MLRHYDVNFGWWEGDTREYYAERRIFSICVTVLVFRAIYDLTVTFCRLLSSLTYSFERL